jgi:cobalt-zinc-cadmium efflux system outer membrane protein
MRLAAAALIVCTATARAEPAALGLAETLRRVADVGPDQAVARAQLPIAAAEVRTARMFPNPSIYANGGKSEPIVAGGLTLRLPILGQIGARVRAAEKALEQTRLEVTLSLWKLRHDARIAYYTAARASDELLIARQIETLTKRVAQIAAERYDAGAGSLLEKLQAQLLEDRALQDVLDRQAVERVARLDLARFVGEPDGVLPALADALGTVGPTPAIDALLGDAGRLHPELHALEAERFAAEARAHSARAELRPAFNVDLGVELLDPTTCNTGPNADSGPRCVGPRGAISFDLPVFNWNGGPIARAEAEARAAGIKRDAAWLRINAQVRAAYESFQAATTRSRFFDTRYVPSATQVEAMAREGFAAGRTGLLPLIEAQRSLLDSRLGQTEARFAVQAARADLEEASGVALSTP